MTIILYMGNSLFLPNYFSFGRDVESAINIDDDVFYKKFKSYKYDNFCKTIFILQTLEDENFVPKLLEYTSKLELYVSYCGNLLKISTLPENWERQLISIKKVLIRNKILFRDWGIWELNPFLINNVCVKDGRLYFIDFGNVEYAERDYIDYYFSKKIRGIKLVLKYGHYYLIYHYLRRLIIMIWRIIKKQKYFIIFFIIYKYLHMYTIFIVIMLLIWNIINFVFLFY